MKKIIYRKIAKDFTIFFSFALILVGLIVWTMQAINFFDLVSEDGHGIKIYFLFSIFNLPKIIHRILPFVYFISIFYIIISYESKNEFNILWINGVNKISFTNQIIFFSFILMFLQILNGSLISPKSQYQARSLLKNSDMDFFSSLLKEGKFINVVKGLTIFIDKKNNDNTYSDVYLDDSTKNGSKIIYAKKGVLISPNKEKILRLYNGQIINKKENDKINVFKFEQINIDLSNFSTNTITAPKIQERNTLALINCLYPGNFLKIKEKITCEQSTLKDMKQELIKRIYKPIYIPLLTIISCFLFVNSIKNNQVKKRNIIFITGFFILILSEASLRYALSSDFNFKLYFSLPILIIIFTYLMFLKIARNV